MRGKKLKAYFECGIYTYKERYNGGMALWRKGNAAMQ